MVSRQVYLEVNAVNIALENGNIYLSFDRKPQTLSQSYLEIRIKNSLIYGLCQNELRPPNGRARQ